MLWRLEWGDKEEFLEDLESKGLNPAALESKPTVYDWMQEYILGFDILSSRRSVGFSVNPISMSDILSYIQIFGCSDIDLFVKFIILMDATFLKFNIKDK